MRQGKKPKKKTKLWVKLVVAGVALVLVLILIMNMMAGALFMSIGGLLNSAKFHSQEEVPEHTDQNCVCGCILSLDNNSGTGSTNNNDIDNGVQAPPESLDTPETSTSPGVDPETETSKPIVQPSTNPSDKTDKVITEGATPREVTSGEQLAPRELPTKFSKGKGNGGPTGQQVVEDFLPAAVASYELYGIYPSVMIGQKLGESGYSLTSSIPNNFYGIKADPSWTGKKGLYTTQEWDSKLGKYITIKAWFREYETPDEGKVAHGGFLFTNPRYRKHGVFGAKNGVEQITAIKAAGYATAVNYIKSITTLMNTNSLQWFDNMENAKYYMQQKGLYDRYLDLVGRIQSGSMKVADGANIANLNKGVGVEITGDESNDAGAKPRKWICNCKIPCPLCSCHIGEIAAPEGGTGEVGDGTVSEVPGVSVSNFANTPGVGQGVWGGQSTEQLCAGTAPIRKLGSKFGTSGNVASNGNFGDWRGSPFKVPYYSQIGAVSESWDNVSMYGVINKGNSCAFNMYAHICSALQQKLINVPEIVCIMAYYKVVDGNGLFYHSSAGANKMLGSFGYGVNYYNKASARNDATWAELDASLNKGIPSGFRSSTYFTTSGSHFLCIDAKIGDKYKLAQTNSDSKDRALHTRDRIYKSMHSGSTCLYIVYKN